LLPVGKERHRRALITAEQHGAGHGLRSEPVAHAVDRGVEGVAAVAVERQRELAGAVALEAGDRHADQREALALDRRHRGREQAAGRVEDGPGVSGRAGQRVRAGGP
jgi:hypothetical protein